MMPHNYDDNDFCKTRDNNNNLDWFIINYFLELIDNDKDWVIIVSFLICQDW